MHVCSFRFGTPQTVDSRSLTASLTNLEYLQLKGAAFKWTFFAPPIAIQYTLVKPKVTEMEEIPLLAGNFNYASYTRRAGRVLTAQSYSINCGSKHSRD